jgi:hypothetical protein
MKLMFTTGFLNAVSITILDEYDGLSKLTDHETCYGTS